MRIIKVNATNSTNSFARDWFKTSEIQGPVCVVAHEQLNGRGQRGASWQSNAGENLTFSVVYPKLNLAVDHQFLISIAVALAIYDSLKIFNVKKLKIKWPNDIMAGNKKIGGILIENFLSNGRVNASIIGVGLNINQERFENLPQASSLKMISSEAHDLDVLLERLLGQLEIRMQNLEANAGQLVQEYHEQLFKNKKTSTFQLPDGSYFVGMIDGVARSGKLRVLVEDDQIREFDIKEVKLCY